MDAALRERWPMSDEDQRISRAVERDGALLGRFVRRRVADPGDAEEIVQEVFAELVEAYRLLKNPERVTAWLFRVARNRITDLYRAHGRDAERSASPAAAERETIDWEDLLASPADGPEAALARRERIDAIGRALGELPAEQREVFLAHEIEGLSFREIAARTGVGVNTLLARKRYAVLRLRRELRTTYDELERR
jgi:RNA polymerase sigma factor (sigma-70 family)